MASVIDGQHRLLGFQYCDAKRKNMELLCSVYLDLPQAYQAYLFATININQRKVDKSLAYEQFGYNLDPESSSGWSPDKVAVNLTRKANLDKDSPLYSRVKVLPLNSELLFPGNEQAAKWQVSTACLVEGICRLISQSPKKDRDALHKFSLTSRKRTLLGPDSSPLRQLYLEAKDEEIYALLKTYFITADHLLWASAAAKSFIFRTLGIQAILDVLKIYLTETGASVGQAEFERLLKPVTGIDFADTAFQGSGRGRVRIKNLILLYSGKISFADLPDADKATYAELTEKYPKS